MSREPSRRAIWANSAAVLIACLLPGPARAGVVILANRTDASPRVTITAGGAARQFQIDEGEVLRLEVAGEAEASFDDGRGPAVYRLAPDSLYYFTFHGGRLVVQRVEFAHAAPSEAARLDSEPPERQPGAKPSDDGIAGFLRMGVVPVMVLVDDEEPAVKTLWEERLRRRVEMASEIIEPYCGIRFRAVAAGTWDTDDGNADWERAMREYEIEVNPLPAALAIGFTSQFQLPGQGRAHLGTIAGPLRPHILIREGPPKVSEPERLEVLVHELGHYLGAVHCPQPDSVMRPLLADGRARSRAFPIRFDGVNALAMSLVGGELRRSGIQTLSQASPKTKQQLLAIFSTAAGAIPGDDVAERHIKMLDVTPIRIPPLAVEPDSLASSARTVVEAVVDAARANCSQVEPASGDELTALLVRRAAAAAEALPERFRKNAFLVGLAVALDDSTLLRNNPLTGPLCRQVETDAERGARLAVLGSPTMAGRHDLAQHFSVSCGLAALLGPGAAETAGVAKELADARRGSGFSFADLAADLAGIALARHIGDQGENLAELAERFSVARFFPDVEDLAEGLAWQEFFESYGSVQDARFNAQRAAILDRIRALPGYGG